MTSINHNKDDDKLGRPTPNKGELVRKHFCAPDRKSHVCKKVAKKVIKK